MTTHATQTEGGAALGVDRDRGRVSHALVLTGLVLWCLVCVPVSLLAMAFVRLADLYSDASDGRHARVVRRLVPRVVSLPVALASPLVAVVPLALADPGSTWFQLGWLVVGLVLAEVYAVCLHRESFVASYQPWRIPEDARPLGALPTRPADRRLQHLVRTYVLYLLPLLVATGLTTTASGPVAWLVGVAFVVKYIAPAWVDYEGYFHWDMHCKVLQMDDAPVLSTVWRNVADWMLGSVVGSVPRAYVTEHLTLHHPANAGPKDLHTPLPFDRTSPLEYAHFVWHTVALLASGWGVVQHRRCSTRQRVLLVAGLTTFWVVTGLLLWAGSLLGWWLLLGLLYRGVTHSASQYVWHGLHDGTGSSRPQSSTILWLPADLSVRTVGADSVPVRAALEQHISSPGSDWAFFDNYHLLHHLHPRAHFTDYPALLEHDLPALRSSGVPVMDLSYYPGFFADLLGRRYDRVAEGYLSGGTHEERLAEVTRRLRPLDSDRSVMGLLTATGAGRRIDRTLSAGIRLASPR